MTSLATVLFPKEVESQATTFSAMGSLLYSADGLLLKRCPISVKENGESIIKINTEPLAITLAIRTRVLASSLRSV